MLFRIELAVPPPPDRRPAQSSYAATCPPYSFPGFTENTIGNAFAFNVSHEAQQNYDRNSLDIPSQPLYKHSLISDPVIPMLNTVPVISPQVDTAPHSKLEPQESLDFSHATSPSPASSSRSVSPSVSHRTSFEGVPPSIDLLLDELTSEEAATSRECAHCRVRASPLWRRHPETYALLCNACGLYLQANNELRPRRLIEDDEIPPPPTDGKVCSHCNTRATSVWRRGGDGQMLCNACGVYYRLRGRERPLELRADRVKRRVHKSRKEKDQ